MKLNKILKINGAEIPLISEEIILQLNAVGIAYFECGGKTRPEGVLEYWIGRAGKPMQRFFSGFVRSTGELSPQKWGVYADESSILLNAPISLALRHASLREILQKISEHTGIQFEVSQNLLALDVRLPLFHHQGSCIDALEHLKNSIFFDHLIWFQTISGAIFFGEWRDCFQAQKTVTIASNLILKESTDKINLPFFAGFTPGRVSNLGLLARLKLQGEQMELMHSKKIPEKIITT